jgi:hypothetical protein
LYSIESSQLRKKRFSSLPFIPLPDKYDIEGLWVLSSEKNTQRGSKALLLLWKALESVSDVYIPAAWLAIAHPFQSFQ